MAAPFARARAIFAMIASGVALTNLPVYLSRGKGGGATPRSAAGMALTNLPVYLSRGKGGGATPRSASGVAHAKRLAAKARNVQRHMRACR